MSVVIKLFGTPLGKLEGGKKMRKKITNLICIIITISILTACTGTNGTEAAPTPPTAPQPEQTEAMVITWGQHSSITQQYISNLRRNGLDEMHELIGRFPEVRR